MLDLVSLSALKKLFFKEEEISLENKTRRNRRISYTEQTEKQIHIASHCSSKISSLKNMDRALDKPLCELETKQIV